MQGREVSLTTHLTPAGVMPRNPYRRARPVAGLPLTRPDSTASSLQYVAATLLEAASTAKPTCRLRN